MTDIPVEHTRDHQKLTADGLVHLFELTPLEGSGTIYFKGDNEAAWQGNTYEGLPISMTGFKKSASNEAMLPKLRIGDGTLDLSPFKPLIHDGELDGANVVHHEILLDNLTNNRNIAVTRYYRVKRIPTYNRYLIDLQLGTASDALGFTIPHRTFRPPAFPAVSQ